MHFLHLCSWLRKTRIEAVIAVVRGSEITVFGSNVRFQGVKA